MSARAVVWAAVGLATFVLLTRDGLDAGAARTIAKAAGKLPDAHDPWVQIVPRLDHPPACEGSPLLEDWPHDDTTLDIALLSHAVVLESSVMPSSDPAGPSEEVRREIRLAVDLRQSERLDLAVDARLSFGVVHDALEAAAGAGAAQLRWATLSRDVPVSPPPHWSSLPRPLEGTTPPPEPDPAWITVGGHADAEVVVSRRGVTFRLDDRPVRGDVACGVTVCFAVAGKSSATDWQRVHAALVKLAERSPSRVLGVRAARSIPAGLVLQLIRVARYARPPSAGEPSSCPAPHLFGAVLLLPPA